MMTVKQVSAITGVSVRTLQQILFFKELDFTLKEIKTIMENPQFDRAAAYKKQQELFQIQSILKSMTGNMEKAPQNL